MTKVLRKIIFVINKHINKMNISQRNEIIRESKEKFGN